ncbi:Mad3/BUB1 homology region 1-domain-containing protein [Pisolithus orientalis]|uniref:Mad3/BUB1 homology region 1-domain-containing protein n=1 Tax=Pisolithus orientalis TaxID=936130 RepID=UPI002224E6BF|nr:Mad3/BUB1 homology region 1-domain-containing protein [Pisolithus orientalis]KAI5989649.1 Mad3/BUB1 homology region 1-domain-containing protein [Pisolithus orientalis]
MSNLRASQLEQERAEYRASITEALDEDEDPLTAYDDYIKWTTRTFSEHDPNSGLVQLLEETVRKFKDDARYNGDLRYLKIWCSYAKVVEKPSVVYAYVVKREIGCVYALLWEEYAIALEKEGRRAEADKAFRAGISRSARPLERLKRRYRDFQSRPPLSKSQLLPFKPSGVAEVDTLRRNPLKNFDPQTSSTAKKSQPAQNSSASTAQGASAASPSNSAHARYAPMLAPPAPGKRPEKLRFNLSLLFTPSGVEYSAAEVRARSMGLLGKKWGPPPASELRDSSSGAVRVNFNDDGSRSTQNMGATASGGGRKSVSMLAAGEPTVTINTKEALADVFGMYNSPDKTVKRSMPGSKYAPVRKIEPLGGRRIEAPGTRRAEPAPPPSENENAKPQAFKPYVDENVPRKENSVAPPKFKPFIEEPKQPSVIPNSTQGRRALSVKDSREPTTEDVAPVFVPDSKPSPPDPPKPTFLKPHRGEPEKKPVFSKPFTPVSRKDPLVRPPGTKPTTECIPENQPASDLQTPAHQAFAPFVDSKTPFKVFSRPPGHQGENGGSGGLGRGGVFTPKPPGSNSGTTPASGPFKPFIDNENAVQPSVLRASASVRKANALQPRVIPATIDETFTDESSLGDGAMDGYGEREPEVDGHAFSSSSSHTNFSEGEDGYAFEGGEVEVEAGLASSSDSQVDDEEGAEQPYVPDHEQQDSYKDDGGFDTEEVEYSEPLGGRFGRINVMTPITERTFEFSTRGLPTPTTTTFLRDKDWRERQGRESGKYAVEVAEKLAREVQEDDGTEGDYEEYEDCIQGSGDHHEQVASHNNLAAIEDRTGTLSLSDSLAVVSAFRPPNPCNPSDPAIVSTLLSLLPADGDFYDLRAQDGGMLDGLQRFAAKKARGSKGASTEDGVVVTLEGRLLRVTEKLGEGGFGAVFSAVDISKSAVEDDDRDLDLDEDEEDEAIMLALKVVRPRNLWEFHVLRRVHRTLPQQLTRSIISPLALYAFRDESHLLLELCQHGTLLDIVNRAGPAGVSQQGGCLDELLVFFYTIELLRFVEGMHGAGFIHGDLKVDNCLLRIEELPGGASSLSSIYQPSGEGGWKYRGIKVIDFGRTIDTSLFPAGHNQQFIADWPTDERDCFEIRQNRPWTYQTDYFGLTGIFYCMLFGKYIEASSVTLVPGSTKADPIYKIATPFKRYWQTDTLTRLFDLLLNPCRVRPDGDLPICEELAVVRKEMETWLQSNCNRSSNTLKGLLKKIELSAYTK